MGRTKATPTKLNNSSENWELPKPLDYIPKRRKSKKKICTTPCYTIINPSAKNLQFHLGDISIGTTSNLFPDAWGTCSATFLSSEEQEEEHLLLQLDSVSVIVTLLLETSVVKAIITSKIFAIKVFFVNGNVHFDLYFDTLPLPKFTKKVGSCIQSVLSLLFNVAAEESAADEFEQSSSTIAQLYKDIKHTRSKYLAVGCENVQHPRLKPILRPYQADAVRWMLHREKQIHNKNQELHPLYTILKLKSGIDIYFDKYSGYVEINKPVVETCSRGGILADEMGLGKTVEVLACILTHTKQAHDYCTSSSPTVKVMSRKRKIEESKESAPPVDEAKKIRVRKDWVRPSRQKSQMRIALELWYHNQLDDTKRKPSTTKSGTSVQCICGNTVEKDTISCHDCGKIQHATCLGYRQNFGEYRCPQCWELQPLIESGTTLIVSPVSLRKQWCNEICKHVIGDFKVLVYGGSSVYPLELVEYDVVITTYSVLQAELRLTDTEKSFSLRYERRYSPPKSPLTRVNWWRLCLDEAQTVETPTTMVSEMAKKLNANFRWAVTGTPISKEISDLYGLIDYLQIEPYNDKCAWQHVLFDPYVKGHTEPMNRFLSQVMWRSSKDEVIDQINIPKQIVEEHWLDFSAVEHYFYRCEHQSNCDSFLQKVRLYNPDKPLQSLDKSSLKTILGPLLSLRQVCTYPNSVRTRYLATKKPVMSMKDLLEALIVKNTNESDEFLRIVLSSLNGLAGIYLLLEIPEQAIEEYRKVLQLYVRFTEEEKIAKLTVDKPQIIHTMHNLAEVLEHCPNVGKTLRDDTLKKDCAEIEQKYMGKFITQSMAALQDSLLISATVEKLQGSFQLPAGKWYSDLLDWMYIHDYNDDLYTKIENAHSATGVKSTFDFRNERTLIYCIATWDTAISKLREDTIDVVHDLYTHCPEDEFQIIIAQELVQKATNCHLLPSKRAKAKKKCPVCAANDHLKAYELKLFSMSKRTTNYEEMSLKGSWKPTTEELVFKAILAVGKAKGADHELTKDGEIHINILDTIKKEFKEVRKLWTHLHQQVSAHDELSMCKIRLRLKEENEEKQHKKITPMLKQILDNSENNKLETIHVLSAHELEYQRTVLHNESMRNLARLEKNLGIRSYLETLKEQQYEGQNLDPCPVCKNTLEQQWSIIPCGHTYCFECIQKLIEQTRGHHVQCCVCRAYHLVPEISYIKTGEQRNLSDSTKIKGNYSTKVESVVKLILDLTSENEDVKILVFSTWLSVLNYVKAALINNDISTELVASGDLEKPIEKFKDPEQDVTTLLLPIHLGSKGLNLIEATHVILIEPLLNLGDELQAIGRVHRIGQTKPTVVHKFFIKNTIEESIQKAVSADAKNWEKNKVTIGQLTNLFIADALSAGQTSGSTERSD